jgi:NAD(P)-dependent dehydrogenase (short-subunit alcohol dehydrogenase family)
VYSILAMACDHAYCAVRYRGSRGPSIREHAIKYFANKTVVITGAGSGIGRACAIAYARDGAHVHGVDIDAARIEEVCADISKQGGAATAHCVNCADAAAMRDLATTIFAHAGRVDVLQNGVGILIAAPAEQMTVEEWRRIIDINQGSAIHGIAAFLPGMLRQGGKSHIVNIASFAGLVAFPFVSAYSMTKYALVGLSEALALELRGRGVYVTAVCPSAVRTRIMDDGEMRLPGSVETPMRRAFSHYAPRPEWLAKKVLRGVRRGRPLIMPSPSALPLWWLKRMSLTAFFGISAPIAGWLYRRSQARGPS